LRPTKVKDLLPSFAMEMERPVEEVSAVVSFYYKTLRSTLSSLSAPSVQIDNLGTFYIKQRALDNELNKTQLLIDKLSSLTITEHALKQNLRQRHELMSVMKELLNVEKERRVEVIQKRFGNEPNQ
jgi:hypothetical protein